MKFTRHILLWGALGFCAVARADTTPSPDNPYGAIVTRNVFGLVPIPTNPPVDVTPAVPPPKITPNGIMDIFGKLQALFKVALPPKPGQPPHDESYVLCAGESQDEIEVTKIDQKAGIITFNNHGTVQELPLVAGVASGGAAPAGGATGGVPVPGLAAQPGLPGANNFGNRFGRTPGLPNPANFPQGNPGETGNPGAGGEPGFGTAGRGNTPQPQETLSPEAQVLLIEANRQKYKAAGSPIANLMPPTPLTQQMQNETAPPPP